MHSTSDPGPSVTGSHVLVITPPLRTLLGTAHQRPTLVKATASDYESYKMARDKGDPVSQGAAYTKSARAQTHPQPHHSCADSPTSLGDQGLRSTLTAAFTGPAAA